MPTTLPFNYPLYASHPPSHHLAHAICYLVRLPFASTRPYTPFAHRKSSASTSRSRRATSSSSSSSKSRKTTSLSPTSSKSRKETPSPSSPEAAQAGSSSTVPSRGGKTTPAPASKRLRSSSSEEKDDDDEFLHDEDANDIAPSLNEAPKKGDKGKGKAPAAEQDDRPSSPSPKRKRKSGHEADDEGNDGKDSDEEAIGPLDRASQEEQANLLCAMMQTRPSASVMAALANETPMPSVEPAILAKVFEPRAAQDHEIEMVKHEPEGPAAGCAASVMAFTQRSHSMETNGIKNTLANHAGPSDASFSTVMSEQDGRSKDQSEPRSTTSPPRTARAYILAYLKATATKATRSTANKATRSAAGSCINIASSKGKAKSSEAAAADGSSLLEPLFADSLGAFQLDAAINEACAEVGLPELASVAGLNGNSVFLSAEASNVSRSHLGILSEKLMEVRYAASLA